MRSRCSPPPPLLASTSPSAPRAITLTSVACWLEVTSQRIALASGAIAVTLRIASEPELPLPSRSFSAALPEPEAWVTTTLSRRTVVGVGGLDLRAVAGDPS